ncbi:MAG: hypothetical protein ACLR4Z_00970 [Butyricicoccaceae bacterium]
MMQLFRMEHLENRFTRMVTVSAGAPETGLRALANDIGVLSDGDEGRFRAARRPSERRGKH